LEGHRDPHSGCWTQLEREDERCEQGSSHRFLVLVCIGLWEEGEGCGLGGPGEKITIAFGVFEEGLSMKTSFWVLGTDFQRGCGKKTVG
jgi:hypothetical protein